MAPPVFCPNSEASVLIHTSQCPNFAKIAGEGKISAVGPGGPMTYKILLIIALIALMAPILLVAIGAMVHGPPHRRAPKKGELGPLP